ncbi:unnamed protein product [marine sediment metagenome]|uniref:Uncharacterized protein n=1 Tax=marine sediment metagenome TaxID=412755 RepID=X1IYJ0_9ZZZZ
MNNYLYYCKDFEKFGNSQNWTVKISNMDVHFVAKRKFNDAWETYIMHRGNRYSISFDEKYDYLPLTRNVNANYKYWLFPEVKREIEDLAAKIVKPVCATA